MALEPAHPRDDRPGPGVCVDGFHEAVVVWTFGPSDVPRRLCAVHIARAVQNAWRVQDDAVTIYHGDARDVLPSIEAQAVITDPPYGINAQDKQHAASSGAVMAWDTEYPHDIINRLASKMPVIAFGAAKTIARELAAFDPTPRVAVWAPRFRLGMIAKDGLAYRWTPIYLFGVKVDGPTVRDVFDEPTEAGNPFNHPSAKPLRLMRALVATQAADVIVDPFMGSGTTLRAAKDLGRRAIGIEIEERYCEIAARRCSQEVLGLVG